MRMELRRPASAPEEAGDEAAMAAAAAKSAVTFKLLDERAGQLHVPAVALEPR